MTVHSLGISSAGGFPTMAACRGRSPRYSGTLANQFIRRTMKAQEDDPRMPAILDDDAWSTWLGEDVATPAATKALLKTMDGVNWKAAPEPKKPRSREP